LKPVKRDGARLIPLTNGYVAIIDAADYKMVSKFKWFAKKTAVNGNKVYAARSQRDGKAVRTIRMHRFIMDCPVGMEVDHKDANRLNNRRTTNLEIVTRQENLRRRRKYKKCVLSQKS